MNRNVGGFLKKNIVTIVFSILCIFSIICSGQSVSFVISETISRISRNAVLILALLMPVLCGMGLNFSIVLGAAAGQIGLILVTHWNLGGFPGITICVAIASALSILLGYFAGVVFNRTVGQEMITGMIIGYFAKGIFDLVFLKLFGKIIPMDNPTLILSGGVGLKNTIEFNENMKYVLDRVLQMPLLDFTLWTMLGLLAVSAIVVAVRVFIKKDAFRDALRKNKNLLIATGCVIVGYIALLAVPSLLSAACTIQVPVFTAFIIFCVCLLSIYISKTKLGQDIRTCGNNMAVASASGIKVARTRIIATIISTVIASWGQIIYLQNMGLVNTYTSHEQVGTYAVAALLVGGASIKKATIGQVFLGALLFHILFFTMPLAGLHLFSDAQIGEYFRVFISYGVIAVSLALYAWNQTTDKKKSLRIVSGKEK